ncbi:MAG TPA: alpha/beta hydrolase [Thermoleophilaceae bacterium]|jgi:pimeloyl-ACP methyl ester carboxylesterase
MTEVRPRRGLLGAVCALIASLLIGVPTAAAADPPKLKWEACGDAGAQCATAKVPKDYDSPGRGTLKLAVAKSPATDQAHKIGSLFFNFGGPGAPAAIYVEAFGADLFPALNERFDIIGMDPRGVGDSQPSIDCHANQETQGFYSEPFQTPEIVDPPTLFRKDRRYINKCINDNPGILPYVSTANVARDMDGLRKAVGDNKLTYLGFSYGTYLGATYASLFPNRYRSLVLDGPVDADNFANRPSNGLLEQTSGFERELGRFLQACAVDQVACSGFGGTDPWDALDQLIDRADQTPIPAPNYAPDPRPIKGDDIRGAAFAELYAKFLWGDLAKALADAANGDGSGIRRMVDEDWFGRDPDTGEYSSSTDKYFLITAADQTYTHRNLDRYFELGDLAWGMFDHFYVNNGYSELNYGLYPIQGRDTFKGPFRVPGSSPTILVVDTTYDPATPYRGGKRLARDLGQTRLLTMRGDNHTAYQGNSACIDEKVEAYLINRELPPPGTSCRQEVPFEAPQSVQALRAAPAVEAKLPHPLHSRRLHR